MNKYELEASLAQVRREKSTLEREIAQMRATARDLPMSEERSREIERNMSAAREARQRQDSTFWGRLKGDFGFGDPSAEFDPKDENDLFKGLFTGIVYGAAAIKAAEEKQRRIAALEIEEGQLLDQLERFKPAPQHTEGYSADEIARQIDVLRAEERRLLEAAGDDEEFKQLIRNRFDDRRRRLLK